MYKSSLLVLTTICLLFSCSSQKINKTTPKPENLSTNESAIIVSNEVYNFWKCFNEEDTNKRNHLLVAYALDAKTNPGANALFRMNINDTTAFTQRINQFSTYYKSVQDQTLKIANNKHPKINTYYKTFKKLYPKAHRPKIILTVGAMKVGGTITEEGLVIGTEFYGKKSTDTTGMGRITDFLISSDDFVPLVFHEHMHYEQL